MSPTVSIRLRNLEPDLSMDMDGSVTTRFRFAASSTPKRAAFKDFGEMEENHTIEEPKNDNPPPRRFQLRRLATANLSPPVRLAIQPPKVISRPFERGAALSRSLTCPTLSFASQRVPEVAVTRHKTYQKPAQDSSDMIQMQNKQADDPLLSSSASNTSVDSEASTVLIENEAQTSNDNQNNATNSASFIQQRPLFSSRYVPVLQSPPKRIIIPKSPRRRVAQPLQRSFSLNSDLFSEVQPNPLFVPESRKIGDGTPRRKRTHEASSNVAIGIRAPPLRLTSFSNGAIRNEHHIDKLRRIETDGKPEQSTGPPENRTTMYSQKLLKPPVRTLAPTKVEMDGREEQWAGPSETKTLKYSSKLLQPPVRTLASRRVETDSKEEPSTGPLDNATIKYSQNLFQPPEDHYGLGASL
ncbi:hypothetical protein BZG36_00218 [Bifiguratus adelaidae]|uniref:Uncharacterized protein n=1 Tax=Bifiguratus adelaidae TaxID=1938954 RepID=A0A261Y8E3_9FUNG|nr:hypothetical protein BZG36_00218 [Bifiguratus adelaidae]